MGRFIYRMCLVIAVVIAVAGGVYYYTTFYQKDNGTQKGTFVNRMDRKDQTTDREIHGLMPENLQERLVRPVMQTGKQICKTAEHKGREVKEAFVYVGESAKNTAKDVTLQAKDYAFGQAEDMAEQMQDQIKQVSGQVLNGIGIAKQ